MIEELHMVEKFNRKYKFYCNTKPALIPNEIAWLRYSLAREEIEEYIEGNSKKDLENVAKELMDILYVVYGTIIAHGLQDKADALFAEVHKSNMTKVCSRRRLKPIKGFSYNTPDIQSILNA